MQQMVASAPQNSKFGYHIIVGYPAVQEWVKTIEKSSRGSRSVVEEFDTDVAAAEIPNIWQIALRFVVWLSYVSGVEFIEDFNAPIKAKLDAIDHKHQHYKPNRDRIISTDAYKSMKKSLIKAPLFGQDSRYIWSLEGITKYLASRDYKFLHFHLLVKTKKELHETRFIRVAEILRQTYGTAITIKALRSKNQFEYILKEKKFAVVTHFSNAYFGSHKFERHRGRLFFGTGVFDEVTGGAGYRCPLCYQASDDVKTELAAAYGWDRRNIGFAFQNSLAAFTTNWKSKSEFDKWLEDQQEAAAYGLEKARTMAVYRATLVGRFLVGQGVLDDEVQVIIKMIFKCFSRFLDELQPEQRAVYKQIEAWIASNISSIGSSVDQRWRCFLVLGGAGGLGKSTLGSLLHDGLGAMFQNLKFDFTKIARETIDTISPVRFYDEAGVSSAVQKNPFFEFTDLECERTRMYAANARQPGLEFTVLASARFNGFPTEEEYLAYHGNKHRGNGDYQHWKEQAFRRFRCVHLADHETFLLPYTRFFQGKDSYHVQRRDYQEFGQSKVHVAGTSMLRRYISLTRYLLTHPDYELLSPIAQDALDELTSSVEHYSVPDLAGLTGSAAAVCSPTWYSTTPGRLLTAMFWGSIWYRALNPSAKSSKLALAEAQKQLAIELD